MNAQKVIPNHQHIKVFISYAHSSSNRKQTVADLAYFLRSKGLTVIVDTDRAPHGPLEGWPKWIKRQIRDATWVLMFFDEIYQRRFDGGEGPDKGHGVIWEGAIIAGNLYRNLGCNKKFISLLADDASENVIPDEIFGFGYYHVPRDYEKLAARLIAAQVNGASGVEPVDSKLLHPVDTVLLNTRKSALWRLAYSFLRLDQLPSGGWGKSLPRWMEANWEGDGGSIIRSPEMRKSGGTDFTCASFYNYVHFVERCLLNKQFATFSRDNPVPGDLFLALKARIDHDLNFGLTGRRVPMKVNLRHTAMGMISLLLCGKSDGFGVRGKKELKITTKYLVRNLKHWKLDKSYPFGMFAALSKLLQLLESEVGIHQFAGDVAEKHQSLILTIRSFLPKIQSELLNFSEYETYPENTQTQKLNARLFFVPYGRFWRMERSGFLMYLPLLITEDGKRFHESIDDRFEDRFFHCFHALLEEVVVPFNRKKPELSLIKYHRTSGNIESPRDWGLSAQLSALLHKGAIRDLIAGRFEYTEQSVKELNEALDMALIATFDELYQHPTIFKFTQGPSFSSSLSIFDTNEIHAKDLIQLDLAIKEFLEHGVTEKSLHTFVIEHIFQINDTTAGGNKKISGKIEPVRDLLLDKLQSGEYTNEEKLWPGGGWERLNRNTIQFYNKTTRENYVARYEGNPVVNFVSRLDDMFNHENLNGMKALDIACGPGQYAKLLKDRGFSVDLFDASKEMLKLAAQSIGKRTPPRPRDYYDLAKYYKKDGTFDLIFASAMMVHVPLQFTQEIYQQFYRLLKPNGILFVNYKIGDHSLISLGGRYFQYYRDRELPISLLKTTGFKIVEVIERWNSRTLDDIPRQIHWVNFFCKKPDSVAKVHGTPRGMEDQR